MNNLNLLESANYFAAALKNMPDFGSVSLLVSYDSKKGSIVYNIVDGSNYAELGSKAIQPRDVRDFVVDLAFKIDKLVNSDIITFKSASLDGNPG